MLRPALGLGVAVLIGAASATVPALAAETVIDDFDAPSSPAPWVFYNGAEFPGATGQLTSGVGQSGKGAHLAYDFSGGGHYVSATLTLPTPLTAVAIAFSARVPAGMHAKLRIRDASNQTFQYDLARPLEAFDASAWFRQVVALSAATSHYGGANDGVVHQPIAAVTLMAADPTEAGAKGAIDFDHVTAVDSLTVRLDPEATPLSPAPPGSADLASRLGVNIHFTRDDRALDIAQAAGFGKVRMDLGWSGVERVRGSYDFSAFDALVSALAARGMKLHLILDYMNPLYPGADSPDFATVTVPAFAAIAEAAARRYAGKGVTYEVWNEPNLDGFWPPRADAAQYASLCKATIASVHRGDPSALVSTGGVAGFDLAFLRAYLAAGGGAGANALGVHPYRQGGGESVSDDLLLMRAIAGAQGLPSASSVWDTEWGYSSSWYGAGHDAAPRATQAQRVARELLSAWALGFPLIIYYDLRDDGTDPLNAEHNFGLIQNDYSDKPAIQAVRALSAAARGRTFAGFVPLAPSSLHALRLDGANDCVVALWADAPGAQLTVSLPANSSAKDQFGNPLNLVTSNGVPSVLVREADGPVYVTVPKRAAGCQITRNASESAAPWALLSLLGFLGLRRGAITVAGKFYRN